MYICFCLETFCDMFYYVYETSLLLLLSLFTFKKHFFFHLKESINDIAISFSI